MIDFANLAIDYIEVPLDNPRKYFDEEELRQLSLTIHKHGVIQPLVVKFADSFGKYSLIIGERRLEAAKLAGLKTVPCYIARNISDNKINEMRVIENVQRSDLTPLEFSKALNKIIIARGISEQPPISPKKVNKSTLAAELGMTRTRFTQCLKLIELPADVHEFFDKTNDAEDKNIFILSQKHGEELFRLLAYDEADKIIYELAQKAYNERLTAEQLRDFIDDIINVQPKEPRIKLVLSEKSKSALNRLKQVYGDTVSVKEKNGVCSITIKSNLEELEDTLALMGIKDNKK